MKSNNLLGGFNNFSTGRHYVGALGTVVMLSRVHNSAVEQAQIYFLRNEQRTWD
jgi:hypothetical protein